MKGLPWRLLRLEMLLVVAAVSATAGRAGAALQEFEPVTVPMPVTQVAPHSYYVLGQAGMVSNANQGFNSNAGFVVTADGVVVFDALGTPALGKRLSDLIANTTKQPVRRIIASTHHADHFYGLQAFKWHGVEVWTHDAVRDCLATDAPAERKQSLFPWVNDATRVVVPDRFISADTSFKMGGLTFHVMHAGPAHTPEDLMTMVEEDGVLFVGDLMCTGRIPFVADADVSAWIKAIDRVLGFKPRIVVGGHGPESTNAVADGPVKVVHHLAEGLPQATLEMGNIRNHLDADPTEQIIVVTHGSDIEFLLEGAKDARGQSFVGPIGELANRGVQFRVCNNTLVTRGIAKDNIVLEAAVVPSGVAKVSRLQANEGYVYLRP